MNSPSRFSFGIYFITCFLHWAGSLLLGLFFILLNFDHQPHSMTSMTLLIWLWNPPGIFALAYLGFCPLAFIITLLWGQVMSLLFGHLAGMLFSPQR